MRCSFGRRIHSLTEFMFHISNEMKKNIKRSVSQKASSIQHYHKVFGEGAFQMQALQSQFQLKGHALNRDSVTSRAVDR